MKARAGNKLETAVMFPDSPYAESILLEADDGTVIGGLAVGDLLGNLFAHSAWVKDDESRHGAAILLKSLIKLGREYGYHAVFWEVFDDQPDLMRLVREGGRISVECKEDGLSVIRCRL